MRRELRIQQGRSQTKNSYSGNITEKKTHVFHSFYAYILLQERSNACTSIQNYIFSEARPHACYDLVQHLTFRFFRNFSLCFDHAMTSNIVYQRTCNGQLKCIAFTITKTLDLEQSCF